MALTIVFKPDPSSIKLFLLTATVNKLVRLSTARSSRLVYFRKRCSTKAGSGLSCKCYNSLNLIAMYELSGLLHPGRITAVDCIFTKILR